ncbi:type IV secretion system protein VirB2-2 [Anaplasma phagocytophilum]|uniref:Type IV secretion system protein n=4 Tax=Anaplasma phagocytophilum TaxID=948 RepID=K9P1I7_ANAPH|nr:type IV secretion system protein VirB2-2 [Anaplasma phagocytophilum]ABD44393.1 Type IV secretion protein VirB2 homolog VirB2-2 [Anaplasma phagocytophilum str. HZ]AFY26746.1 type IV secretion system protein [Anaplasma phagocytophilum]AGR79044.1 type VI secretion protein [Anaplasma phagocytophilum str. HZ2]AGR81546.1 type VI secretion protein [Anaplasma phagocytophilum str. Dog2]EOA61369.1 VirB2 [Anaplasma phagocytophilum str. HGE1]
MFGLTRFMAVLALVVALVGFGTSAFASTTGSDDVAAKVICNVVVFVQRLGLPIMTGVILGASIMAIFGKLAWAAIVMLVVFTAIFFGAGKLIQKFAAGVGSDIIGGNAESFECKGNGATTLSS